MSSLLASPQASRERELPRERRRPRLGFLGLGWIGRNRMESVARTGLAEIAALWDSSGEAVESAGAAVPGAARAPSLEAMLDLELDGLVIATPNALHADQTVQALERGVAVFCQKPLGRNASETERVVATARTRDRLLGVDLSYRQMAAVRRVRELIQDGALGEVFMTDLVFHNAYGPNKPWFYDRAQSGGGCLIDLGTHLVDLAFWLTGSSAIENVSGRLFAKGRPLKELNQVEDFAEVRLDMKNGATVRIACSWHLPAGCDADISFRVFGNGSGAAVRNVNGSFYDFVAESYQGTQRQVLAEPPDDWGGRAIIEWVRQLGESPRFRNDIESSTEVAGVLEAVYEEAIGK